MATNDFLPFAVGGSANVLPQSSYAALTSVLQNGFSSGLAKSVQLNKVWRRSSIMSSCWRSSSSIGPAPMLPMMV